MTASPVGSSTGVDLASIASALAAVGIESTLAGDIGSRRIRGVAHDSRAVRAGDLFACLRGDAFDGHEFASQAVARGAVALLTDHPVTIDGGDAVPQLVVEDTRRAVGLVASAAFGHPSSALDVVGITGTNGKTTTAQMVAWVLDVVGRTAGIVGTLHGVRTTPEAPDLQSTLAAFVADGRRSAVMEVSSHALELHRVDGTKFDVVAFTNFGHDHLDLHGSPENYFRAKSALFTAAFAPVAVLNVDDTHGRLLADTISDREGAESMRVVEVGAHDISDVRVAADRHSYRWRGVDVVVPVGGDVNVRNSLLALTILAELDVDPARAAAAIASMPQVPGRFELVTTPAAAARGIRIVVDYAHTPDGLELVLGSVRRMVDEAATDGGGGGGDGRVVVVFGCGGERDREKRPEMGAVASELADVVVVTSDNPRHENPTAIIDDILRGVPERYRGRVTSNPDRREAITEAIDQARPGDFVVIAGKGHERTQDLGGTTIDFDDRAVAAAVLDDTMGHHMIPDTNAGPTAGRTTDSTGDDDVNHNDRTGGTRS